MFWHHTSVVVLRHLTVIECSYIRIFQTFSVVVDRYYELAGNKTSRHQFQRHSLRHFPYYHTCFLEGVGRLEHLSAAEGVCCRSVCLYRFYGTRLPSPGVVDEQFRINAKELVQQFLVVQRCPSQLSHSVYAIESQPFCCPLTHSPELGNRTIVPQLTAVRHLVEFRNAYTVGVGRSLLCHDVHSHLAQIHISTYACRRCYARLLEHVAYHLYGELVRRHLVAAQVVGDVHEHLVDAVHVDILGSHIP